jgi:UDP-glucose 4-epimerase
VYGHCTNMPIREDENLQPISPYGESKIAAEEQIREHQDKFSFGATILRMFNVYGPGQLSSKRNSYSGVITRFMENVNNKQDLVIFGDGGQTWDFVNIADAINGFMLALTRNVSGTFNIGTGLPTSIDQLARQIIQLRYRTTDEDDHLSRITRMDPRPGDIRDSCADISAATSALGYTPKVSLRHGLRELYEFSYPTLTPGFEAAQDIEAR